MSIRRKSCVSLVCGLVLLLSHGCVMRRTVKEDGVVVAKGYVVKAPILDD